MFCWIKKCAFIDLLDSLCTYLFADFSCFILSPLPCLLSPLICPLYDLTFFPSSFLTSSSFFFNIDDALTFTSLFPAYSPLLFPLSDSMI